MAILAVVDTGGDIKGESKVARSFARQTPPLVPCFCIPAEKPGTYKTNPRYLLDPDFVFSVDCVKMCDPMLCKRCRSRY
jgi:hypothetical protein